MKSTRGEIVALVLGIIIAVALIWVFGYDHG
jgi:hypothetical protein